MIMSNKQYRIVAINNHNERVCVITTRRNDAFKIKQRMMRDNYTNVAIYNDNNFRIDND
jgi:hypothetical protein